MGGANQLPSQGIGCQLSPKRSGKPKLALWRAPRCPPSVPRLLRVEDGQLCFQRRQPQPRVGAAVPVLLALTFIPSTCVGAQL